MLQLYLRKNPDPLLRKSSKNIKEIDDNIQQLAEELTRVLQEHHALGLAAPQLGELVRMFVFTYRGRDVVVINPKLKHKKGVQFVVEGCVSLPEQMFMVKRPERLTLFGTDLHGKEIKLKAEPYYAPVIEHEYDHLDGIMIDKKGKLLETIKPKTQPYGKLAWA
jgi:peptide deformylase